MRMIALGGLAALVLAGPALAAPDSGAVSTASDTDELIAGWLKSPPPAALEPGRAEPDAPVRDNKVHGEVGFGIGTQGYREVYGVADIPLGEKADATVAVRDVQGRAWGANVHSRSVAVSLALGDAARPPTPPACAGLHPGRYVEPLWVTRMRAARGSGLAACPGAAPEG